MFNEALPDFYWKMSILMLGEEMLFKNKEYFQQNNSNRLMPGIWVVNVSLDDDSLSFLLKWNNSHTMKEQLGTTRITDRNDNKL